MLRSQRRVYDGSGEVARTQDVWGAEGISGRVKFLPLAWAGMPKTSFRKNSDSPNERTGTTLLLGSILTLLSLLIFINPIRQHVSILATMFLSYDRPEDRPNTLLWLTTQFMGSYFVLAIVAFYLAKDNAVELLYIPILINGIGDGLAEPVGIRFGKHHYETRALFSTKKYTRSLEGSACVFITSILVIYLSHYPFTDLQFVVAITAIPILMTLAEAFSPHTWDSPLLYGTGGMTLIGILQLP